MTLLDLAERLEQFDDNKIIYAKRSPDWSATSEAIVCDTPQVDSHPPEAQGLAYFLEVSLAKETVQVWSEWRDGRQPTPAEKLDAMLYYAEYDAWLPVNGEKPIEADPLLLKQRFIEGHGGLSKERCRWRDCPERRIAKLAFCFEHYHSRPSSH